MCVCVRFRSTSNPQIHVPFLRHRHLYLRSKCPFFKFSNWRSILKSMADSHFLKSTSNYATDVCPNPNQQIGHISINLERKPI